MARKAVICDIDGTIAEMVDRGPFEYDKVSEDKPIYWVIHLLQAYLESNKTEHSIPCVIFVTGRLDICYSDTMMWLDKFVMKNNTNWALHMRPKERQYDKDYDLKRDIYHHYIGPLYQVEFVLEDRQQVVDMYRDELDLNVLQTAKGRF